MENWLSELYRLFSIPDFPFPVLHWLRLAVEPGPVLHYVPESEGVLRMSEQPRGLVSSAGWAVIHLFYRIDRARWRALPAPERTAAIAEFSGWLEACATEEGLQIVPFAGVTKSDVGFM